MIYVFILFNLSAPLASAVFIALELTVTNAIKIVAIAMNPNNHYSY